MRSVLESVCLVDESSDVATAEGDVPERIDLAIRYQHVLTRRHKKKCPLVALQRLSCVKIDIRISSGRSSISKVTVMMCWESKRAGEVWGIEETKGLAMIL